MSRKNRLGLQALNKFFHEGHECSQCLPLNSYELSSRSREIRFLPIDSPGLGTLDTGCSLSFGVVAGCGVCG